MTTLRSIAEAALDVAQERADLIGRMRSALIAGDESEALRLARQVAGLDEESDAQRDRVDSRQH